MSQRVQMNFRTDEDTAAKIELRATKIGVSRNEWMERALKWALAQPETERPKTIKERV